MSKFGINRVPADVDATSEAMAEIEAIEINAIKSQPMGKCNRCGRMISRTMLMSSHRGSVCPDCYDEE